jgi:hypothetical protein
MSVPSNKNHPTSNGVNTGQGLPPLLGRPSPLGSPTGNNKLPVTPSSSNNNGAGSTSLLNTSILHFFRVRTLAGQFRLLVLVAIILAMLALGVTFWVLGNVYQDFYTIASNSAPSVKIAQDLGQAVQNADTAAANYQLYARINVTRSDYDPKVYGGCQHDNSGNATTGLSECAWQDFLSSRQQVYDLIYQARINITYPGEADAVNAITNRFLDYTGLVTTMKTELDQGHSEAALAIYKSAEDILTGNLGGIPLDAQGHSPEEQLKLKGWQGFDPTKLYLGIAANVHKLGAINQTYLDKAFAEAQSNITVYLRVVVVVYLLLIICLALLCFRHAQITHRVLNLGYSLALVGALLVSYFLLNALITTNNAYRNLQTDFTTINAIAQAQLLLADGNADESRVLLNPSGLALDTTNTLLNASVLQRFDSGNLKQDFLTKQKLITNTFNNLWISVNSLSSITTTDITEAAAAGYLCKITPEPSANTCPNNSDFALSNYLRIDSDIRQALDIGLLAKAISIDIGYQPPDGSDYYFNIIDQTLNQLSNLNSAAFDKISCEALGPTNANLGHTCITTNIGSSIPFLQISIWVVLPFVALSAFSGFWFIRRQF